MANKRKSKKEMHCQGGGGESVGQNVGQASPRGVTTSRTLSPTLWVLLICIYICIVCFRCRCNICDTAQAMHGVTLDHSPCIQALKLTRPPMLLWLFMPEDCCKFFVNQWDIWFFERKIWEWWSQQHLGVTCEKSEDCCGIYRLWRKTRRCCDSCT